MGCEVATNLETFEVLRTYEEGRNAPCVSESLYNNKQVRRVVLFWTRQNSRVVGEYNAAGLGMQEQQIKKLFFKVAQQSHPHETLSRRCAHLCHARTPLPLLCR